MKFYSLFKKELRELVTFQTLLGVIIGLVVFGLLGQFMSTAREEMTQKMGSVVVCDMDRSDMSRKSIETLKTSGFEIYEVSKGSNIELIEQAKKFDHSSVLVFPEGLGRGLSEGRPQKIWIASEITGFSFMSGRDSSAETAAESLKDSISTILIQSSVQNADPQFLKNPVATEDITVVNGLSENVNTSQLQSFAMQQTVFIPIIIFILITFASQLNASAIATEKGDKTLETLLSAPISRVSVLGAKMCASGVLSLVMAAVYMIGFSSYMGGIMGTSGEESGAGTIALSLKNLGLQLGAAQYLLIGIQLFLTIMIALGVSMILGALSKDVKSANSMIAPLMFLVMIPYFVTMFADVESLPFAGKVLLYVIPFTHTFNASANLLFGHWGVFFGGMAYQTVFLIIVMAYAVRVFSTDKIFTMKLEWNRKRTKKTV